MNKTVTTPLIKREILFGNPERTSPKLSRDAKYLAYLAPDQNNVLQVWLQKMGETETAKLTDDPKRGIRFYFWTYQPGKLIYIQDADGDENFHLYQVDVNTRVVRDLTPFAGVKAQLVEMDHAFPDVILVGLNRNNPEIFDVYRLDLNTTEVELETENPGNIVSWTADSQLQIRGAIAATADGGSELLYRESKDSSWQSLRIWGPDDQGGIASFSEDNKTLYILGSHNANTERLIALDLETKAETVIASDPHYDVSSIMMPPTERRIQAVSFYKDKEEWQVLDATLKADFEILSGVRRGEFDIVSRDLADQNWLVRYITDDGPVYYYLYARESQAVTLLFSNQPQLEELPLVTMEPISYTARDGLTIHGYLSLPSEQQAPYPTVLYVHGGPWARDTWGYSPTVQWLANRGYAVLQVNFRGSTGYGKDFVNAGNREWGAAMHNDLIDAVDWVIKKGISQPDKIAIMGGSYGGYAALAGLTFTPDTFACGVDIVGPSNLVTLMQSIPPYWAPLMAMFQHRVGNLETEKEFLESRSPLFFVDRITKPLLIGQGANDPRVKQAESEQIVAAMRAAGKPVKYVLYTDEGHGFARPENRLHFFAVAEEFLAKYLGGRFEPMTEIVGHSGQVS